jgi:hypothetical protein
MFAFYHALTEKGSQVKLYIKRGKRQSVNKNGGVIASTFVLDRSTGETGKSLNNGLIAELIGKFQHHPPEIRFLG